MEKMNYRLAIKELVTKVFDKILTSYRSAIDEASMRYCADINQLLKSTQRDYDKPTTSYR